MDSETKLEKVIEQGIYGPPELRREEKNKYLGVFRERILIALTKEQVEEPGVYPEVISALRDVRASKLVMRRDVDLIRARDYLDLAKKMKVAFKRVDLPGLKGDIGLVIASSSGIDVPDILTKDRKSRLLELGLSKSLIQAVGKKICVNCWNKLATNYPEELVNYRRITWIDSITGTKCPGCLE